MTTEEWLKRVKKADDYVENLKYMRIIALNSLCGGFNDTGNERVQTSRENSTEAQMVAYAAYADMINRAIDNFVDIRQEVISAINRVERDEYRELLMLRYLGYKTWEYIANKLNAKSDTLRKYTKYQALKAVAPYCK